MLPDFPKEKALIAKFWNDYLAHKHRELLGPFAEFPSFSIHEGNRWKIERMDGSGSEQEYEEMLSEFAIANKDIPNLTPEEIKAKLDMVAEDSARQVKQRIFREMQKASEASGNVFGQKGQPLTKELFLEMFEKIGDFDNDGQWQQPFVVMTPDLLEANKGKFEEWNQDKEFLARREEIVNRRREEWHAREALRKLVD